MLPDNPQKCGETDRVKDRQRNRHQVIETDKQTETETKKQCVPQKRLQVGSLGLLG